MQHVYPSIGLKTQKYDLYINEEGTYELLFSSQQLLVKAFRKHCCKVIFPHIRQKLPDKMKEEKEAALALLNDELQDRGNQLALISDEMAKSQRKILKLKQNIAVLQVAVERLKRRVVPHLEDTRKDNGITIIQKNNGDPEYPYIAICG